MLFLTKRSFPCCLNTAAADIFCNLLPYLVIQKYIVVSLQKLHHVGGPASEAIIVMAQIFKHNEGKADTC